MNGLTLIVEHKKELATLYAVNLKTWLGLDSITIIDETQLESSIRDNDFSLIIIKSKDFGNENVNLLKSTLAALESSKKEVQLVVLGKKTTEFKNILFVQNTLALEELIRTCAKCLGITAKGMAQTRVPKFYPIPISCFLFLKRAVCDVYIKADDDLGYEKILESNKEFQNPFIKQYLAQGTQILYVRDSDRLRFVSNLTQEIVSKIDLNTLSDDEKITAMDLSHQLLSNKIKQIGITPETVKESQKQIKEITKQAARHKKIGSLLKRLRSNKTSYLFLHSQMLTFVGTHLMQHIDWGNQEQKEKIAFIAYFHDILLEDDAQAQIHSNLELKESNLPDEKKKLVETHAQQVAEMITKYPHAPMGVDIILRQHHGINHGIGFAETYSGNLSPMAIVFIVCEYYVDQLLKNPNSSPIDIIKKTKEKFKTQRFHKIIEVLGQIQV